MISISDIVGILNLWPDVALEPAAWPPSGLRFGHGLLVLFPGRRFFASNPQPHNEGNKHTA